MTIARPLTVALLCISPLLAQPVQSRGNSTFDYTTRNGEKRVEITNVGFDITGDSVPGRPRDTRMVLRTTTHTVQVIGDKGLDAATVLMEAWTLGSDLQSKPLYANKVSGVGAQVVDDALWVAARGTDETSWWSVYRLGTGQHLFNTYIDLLRFSISKETLTLRYLGLDVPEDGDSRLKDPHFVAVLVYASDERVVREALITADNTDRAAEMRSFADTVRTLTHAERTPGQHSVQLSFTVYPAPTPATLTIPILKDDLDLAHATLAPGVHIALWKH